MPRLITLTTDFGVRDCYVAAMKGVIASRCPDAVIMDLTHEIPPHDVLAGALFVAGAMPYFPADVIHVVVVDPGVGTERRATAVRAGGATYVCPDNGLLTLLLRRVRREDAREICNAGYVRDRVSTTFHGRDVFAPAAAALAKGAPFGDIGPRVGELVRLDVPQVRHDVGRVVGEVVHVDRFGNAVTNIHRSDMANGVAREIAVSGEALNGISHTYGDVSPGAALAIWGSSDYLEIAVNRGRADSELGAMPGVIVEVCLE